MTQQAQLAESPPREGMFCKTLPNMQKVWDSTSLGYLFECDRKYDQSILQGYRKDPEPPPFWFGKLIHRGIETMLKEQAKGNKDYLTAAIKVILGEGWGYQSDDNRRTRMTLVRSLIWYDSHFTEDPMKIIRLSNGKVAAELSFMIALPITSPDGDPYMLSGHLDAVVEFMKQLWVLEHKHTVMDLSDNYFKQYTPNTQVSVYSLAAKVILKKPIQGVIVNAMQVGVGYTRFLRRPIPRSKVVLDEWLNDVCFKIKMAEHNARANRWPLNDQSCNKFSGCVFREACAKGPQMRKVWLEDKFVRKYWNPLESR